LLSVHHCAFFLFFLSFVMAADAITPAEVGLGLDVEEMVPSSETEDDAASAASASSSSTVEPVVAADEDDGGGTSSDELELDGNGGSSGSGDESSPRRRRRECELLLNDLDSSDGRKPWIRSKIESLKLIAEFEHRDRAQLYNMLAHGVMPAMSVLPSKILLALPLAELIKMNAEIESRTKLVVWCHRRGIGCPGCSHYNYALLKVPARARGYNRSATRWWQSPDFWPQDPF